MIASFKKNPLMVFPGCFWNGSTEHGLAGGFREAGWIVHEIDMEKEFGRSITLAERAFSTFLKKNRMTRYQKTVLSACHHLQPDLLFIVKGSYLSKKTFHAVRDMGIRIVCFWPDYDFEHPGIDVTELLKSDCFVTTKSFHIPWLLERVPGERACFVPHGYDPNAHAPILKHVAETDYSADIRYIGNHSAYKQQWIEGLHHALPSVNLRITGHRWSKNLSKRVVNRLVEAEEYVAADYALAIQTARINVAVHFGKGQNGWEDRVSTRTFEIPACGGFMLHIDNDEVREYYDVGKEIDVFSDIEELADKCRYYLKNDGVRRRMVQKAHERCVPTYSYYQRAKEVLLKIEKIV